METYIVYAKHSMYPNEFNTLTYFFYDIKDAKRCKMDIENDTDGEFVVYIYKASEIN